MKGDGTERLWRHHLRRHRKVSDAAMIAGNRVEVLPDGASVVRAVMDALERARRYVHMEYYTVDDVTLDGRSFFTLMEQAVRRGVEVALIWDAVGSGGTPDRLFDRLSGAGVRLVEYHPINPFKKRFNLAVNDRDHRKLTVMDGELAIMGGVNMSRVYETPESAGRGSDPDHAFWVDNGIRFQGPAVAEVHRLFFHTWDSNGGSEHPPLLGHDEAAPAACGPHTMRVAGSAPAERKPLFNQSIRAAIRGTRSHLILATGYFVPTSREWRLLCRAARRGVQVDLLLPGYSDVQSAVHAARSLYGPLLKCGARIHEVRHAMLHAKVATFDGVLTVIGTSNFDRRSVHYNNEVDAVIMASDVAGEIERILRAQIERSAPMLYADWAHRSLRERALEMVARLWRRLM
ncbi:phosphatidylserine/phosphatidylglycerophosphate/cardiolipin synthase family protein [Acetobacteraceae bacterium KSS8]|uniref:Phospholipase D n=1 Tax=Endosaccharibacter trunci TaxID=2812733 RepID=A0ABT1W2H8_9PROT|nr:phosphatidylserine/phosphatidylglycerophosphate/cardiolipin synthase family protein [Acetobacteraceae bacterium KSS8]